MSTPHQSRADRRRATEARILDSARELFAEKGFDRTTIRAVATAASVDPALVMQYFGSKRELFAQSVQAFPVLPTTTTPTCWSISCWPRSASSSAAFPRARWR
ncbi:helix-turn-helix domain-containing protein [Streptomyces aureus]